MKAPERGQRVSIARDHVLAPWQIDVSFEIEQVRGDGDDAFISVKDDKGRIYKWFRATELQPARRELAPRDRPRVVIDESKEQNISQDLYNFASLNAELDREAQKIWKEEGGRLRDATTKAGRRLADRVEAYHLASRDHSPATPAPQSQPTPKSNAGATALHAQAERLMRERGLSADDALREVAAAARERFEPQGSTPAAISLRADDTLVTFVARTASERTGGDQKAAYDLLKSALPALVESWSNGTAL